MQWPWLELQRWHYDDEAGHFQVAASNGIYAAAQEFYANPVQVTEFGSRLAAFPQSPQDEVRLEAGKDEAGWAYWLLMRAYLFNRAGDVALLFECRNLGQDPWRAEARFTITCQVASLNRLGASIVAWGAKEGPAVREELAPCQA